MVADFGISSDLQNDTSSATKLSVKWTATKVMKCLLQIA